MEALGAVQYPHKRAMQTCQRGYLEGLQSCSVLSKRALQIDQRRCLGNFESNSVHKKRNDADSAEAMRCACSRSKGMLSASRYLESLESSSVLTYRALQIEQRKCLVSLESCRWAARPSATCAQVEKTASGKYYTVTSTSCSTV